MIEYWIAYRDVDNYEPRRSFEYLEPPSAERGMIEEQVIVRGVGTQDIYVRWHHWFIDKTKLHLVTCTHGELSLTEVRDLAIQAIRFGHESDPGGKKWD